MDGIDITRMSAFVPAGPPEPEIEAAEPEEPEVEIDRDLEQFLRAVRDLVHVAKGAAGLSIDRVPLEVFHDYSTTIKNVRVVDGPSGRFLAGSRTYGRYEIRLYSAHLTENEES